MRAERWWQEASVTDEVFKQATAFELIQATRLLRHTPYQNHLKYWADDFRFNSSLALNFPLKEIESLNLQDDKVQLTNLMVGLTGMQGAMPYSYTNKVKMAARKQRIEAMEFLSLFNHKLTALYIDSCISYHLPVKYEIEKENDYLKILHALNGYVSEQHQQQELDDYFAEFAGLMQGQNNTAHALKTMLSCVFKQQVHVQEFVEEKFKLSADQKTKLGGSTPSLLGVNTFCGDTIKQIDGKIEIQMGPLNREAYLQLLPNQALSKKLKSLLQSWCSPTLMVDLRLILDKSEVKPLCLSVHQNMGLSQGAFLMPDSPHHNEETCYVLIGTA